MRFAVISDIHANLEALKSILSHIEKRKIEEIICLGDIIGYGPNPIECTELIMEKTNICLKGNHDEALIEGVCFFNQAAKDAILWTEECFNNHKKKDEFFEFFKSLPLIYTLDNYIFVHGSPLEPTLDYLLPNDVFFEKEKFEKIFNLFDKILIVGHTHIPCIITESLKILKLEEIGYKYKFQGEKIIINVGSVGQPRDKDPRSSYIEVIDDFIFFHRVPYNSQKVCDNIVKNPHLDDFLGERLLNGN